MEVDGTLRALKDRWGRSLVTEADVEAEQSAGGTGLGAGDPADDGGAAGTEAPADDAADASGQGAAGASGAEGGASR